MRLHQLIPVAIILALAGGCASNPVAEADEALEAGNFSKALEIYEKALKEKEVTRVDVGSKVDKCRSELASQARSRANALVGKGEYEKALKELDGAKKMQPGEKETLDAISGVKAKALNDWTARGVELEKKGDVKKAVALWKKARKFEAGGGGLQRRMVGALVRAAEKALNANNFQGASTFAKEAQGLDPKAAGAKKVLGSLAEKRKALDARWEEAKQAQKEGDYEKASRLYQEALQIWPGHPEVAKQAKASEKERLFWKHFRLGDTFLARREWDKALENFEKAKEADPLPKVQEKIRETIFGKWMEEGRRLQEDKRFKEAVRAYEKALEVAKEKRDLERKIRSMHYEIQISEGIAFEVDGKWILALKAYEKARKFAADPSEVNRRLLKVKDHIVVVKCDTCNGTGQVDNYKKVKKEDGTSDLVKVGTKACPTCGGSGKITREKD